MKRSRIFLAAAAAAFTLLLTACQAESAPVIQEISPKGMILADETQTVAVSLSEAPEPTTEAVRNGVFLNLKEMGAKGDGVTDDTEIFRQALEQVTETGGTVYIPAGEYYLSERLNFNGENITICGDGQASRLIYYCDQTRKLSDTDRISKTLLFMKNGTDIVIRDLYIEMVGEFFDDLLESYHGAACGIIINNGTDVLIENVEITGFNSSGIHISGAKYSKNVTVRGCHIHHNRVAGVLFGDVDGLLITDCVMEYMGSPKDAGTGYGCAGASDCRPLNVRIVNNQANYNYRKGIDMHAGENAVIEGNTCNANRLYGIYTEGPKTNHVVIKDNIISNMNYDDIGLGEIYDFIIGIAVGPYTAADGVDYEFQVIGNVIENFGLVKGDAIGIQLYGPAFEGTYTVKDNIITGTDISRLIVTGGGIASPTVENSYIIEGNHFYAEKLKAVPISFGKFRELIFTNNTVEIKNCASHSEAVIRAYNSSKNSVVYMRGNVLDAAYATRYYELAEPCDAVLFADNIVNGKPFTIAGTKQ